MSVLRYAAVRGCNTLPVLATARVTGWAEWLHLVCIDRANTLINRQLSVEARPYTKPGGERGFIRVAIEFSWNSFEHLSKQLEKFVGVVEKYL